MINFDDVTNRNIKEHWPQIPDHPLIIEGFGSRKTNQLFILISHQPDIDKIYLHAYEAKIHMKQNINY